MNRPVLVLNQNYEALNLCSCRRALVLVLEGKAEMLVARPAQLWSASGPFPCPSVIRLHAMVRRPRPSMRLSRREVFIRDNFTCQYCGRRGNDLTIDHVIPRSRGGQHSWLNLVSACRGCNHRKGGKLLHEARMQLYRQPFEPSPGRYYAIERRIAHDLDEGWVDYLPGFVPPAASATTLARSAD